MPQGVPILHLLSQRPLASDYENWLSSKNLLGALVGYEVKWTPGPDDLARPEPAVHPVKQFHSRQHPAIVVRAPIRTSKSKSAAFECLHDGLPYLDAETKKPVHDERVIWMVGVDYSTLKEWEYVWDDVYPNDFEWLRWLGGTVTQKYNTPASGNLRLVVEWGRATSGRVARTVWSGKSSSNEVALQGEEVMTACLSEAMKHDQRIVDKYLSGRSKRMLFPSTSDRSARWLKKRIDEGLYEEIVYTRECNPVYDWPRYIRRRAQAIATWGRPELDLEFMEQFEGEWVFEGGKIIPFRWIEDPFHPSHIVDERDPRWLEISEWLPFAEWFVGMDYGYTDPACAQLWAVAPDGQKLIVAEIYEKYLSNPAFIARMRERLVPYAQGPIKQWIPDPQKPELSRLMEECGLPVARSLRSHLHRDRTASFRALIDALSVDERTGRPALLVHRRCENTIHEWKDLRRREDWNGDEFAKGAIYGLDHAVDCARYMALVLRHYRAAETMPLWYRRHEEKMRLLLDREASYDSFSGVRHWSAA